MRRLIVLMITTTLMVSGCSGSLNESNIKAQEYLKGKGYKVVAYDGKVEEYRITREKLSKNPYMSYWRLQEVNPSDYLGETLNVEKFIIVGHPLDNWTSKKQRNSIRSKGKTEVYVFLIDNNIIGGVSFPVLDKLLVGGYWDIDGRTLGELKNIKDLKNWKTE